MNELQRVEADFAQVANRVLWDKKLSLKAKGMFAYLYSRPVTWQFSADRIAFDHSDGRKSAQSALKELETSGYLQRRKKPDGRIVYLLGFTKEPKYHCGTLAINEPKVEKGKVPKRQSAETDLISNTQGLSNTESESNTDIATTKKVVAVSKEKLPNEINAILEAFVLKLNPTLNWGNKTQRRATQELLAMLGKERLLRLIDYAQEISGQAFAPVITTPYQLKEKYAQLRSHYQKHTASQNTIAVIS